MKPSLTNSLGWSIWGNKPPLICTVNHTEEAITMYQVARMPPQQLALLWQVCPPLLHFTIYALLLLCRHPLYLHGFEQSSAQEAVQRCWTAGSQSGASRCTRSDSCLQIKCWVLQLISCQCTACTSLQDYVRELAICLAVGGDALRLDADNAIGQRMTTLRSELCQLCMAKASSDLESHRVFLTSRLMPVFQSPAPAAQEPNWLVLGVSMMLMQSSLKLCTCCLSASQSNNRQSRSSC